MKTYFFSLFFFFFTGTFFSSYTIPYHQKQPAKGVINGKVISIIDGDTYDIRVENRTNFRIRMEGIDAPEKGMAYYINAKQYLSNLIFNKTVSIDTTKRDRNKRIVSYTWLEGRGEIGAEMLKAGLAWHFKKYNQSKEYATMEELAKRRKKGLWVEKNPLAPWDKRAKRRGK